jgi:phosphatidylethanolamine/phosphatidyl-N-methylethanolamine N-methyltransferase
VSIPTQSFYNTFSLFYPLVDIFLRPQKKVLCKEVNQVPDGNLLEVGVGNGSHLQQYKKHRIIGIDTSAAMLKIAGKRNPTHVQLLEMNGEELLFPNGQFDYVVLSHVIAVVDNPEKLLEEAFRVLRPNGQMFILNHFTPNNWLKYVDQGFGLLCCVGLEIFQWLHFTNGRFDLTDIGVSFLGWLLAVFAFDDKANKQNIMTPLNGSRMVCFASYGIVYLSHVLE